MWIRRVRWHPNGDASLESNLVRGDDDRGRADQEDFEEGALGEPAFEVGEGKGAFGRVEGRPCGTGAGRGRGGNARAESRVREEGKTRCARNTRQNRPVQRGREDVPT